MTQSSTKKKIFSLEEYTKNTPAGELVHFDGKIVAKAALGFSLILGLPSVHVSNAQVVNVNPTVTGVINDATPSSVFVLPGGGGIGFNVTSSYMSIGRNNNGVNIDFEKSGNDIIAKNVGDCIDASLSWSETAFSGILTTGSGGAGPFISSNNSDGYIAFRFASGSSGTNFKYGFMKIVISSQNAGDSQLTAEFAQYNDTPGAQIKVVAAALPVELVDFTARAEDKSIALSWTTAMELNNSGFEVQRSTDGRNFEKVEFVRGNDTTDSEQNYQYTDRSLEKGKSYLYRLKQIDFDGAFELSEVVSVFLPKVETTVGEFFPNPTVNGIVKIKTFAQDVIEGQVEVFDAFGKMVHSRELSLTKDFNESEFNFSELGTGIYFAKFSHGTDKVYRKFVIN